MRVEESDKRASIVNANRRTEKGRPVVSGSGNVTSRPGLGT